MIRGTLLLALLAAGALWMEPERVILSGDNIQPAYTVAASRPVPAAMGQFCTTVIPTGSGSGSMPVLTPCVSVYTVGTGGGGSR